MLKSAQIVSQIQQMIQNGSLKAHQKLPSLREQSVQSGFSLMTVLSAYQQLEALGLIYSKQKSGFYVADAQLDSSSASEALRHMAKIEINSQVFHYLKDTQQPQIISLCSAFPDHKLLFNPRLMSIIAQHAKKRPSYQQYDNLPPGNLALRQLIANKYLRQGIATTADDIVITSGALDALNLSLEALTQAGDYILLQQHIFYGAWQASERLGLQVISIPEHPQFGFDLDAFEHALQRYPIKVCWLMLNSHNPIGFTVSDEIKARIGELLRQYQVHLIEDDVYQELYFGQQKPLSMKYFDQDNDVVHCSSFSKLLGSGTRIGWVHAGRYSEAIQHRQQMRTLSASPLIQNALVDFISSQYYEKHLRTLRRTLAQNKKQFYQALQRILPSSCEIQYFESGYFLWIKLPESVNANTLYQTLLAQNIGISPSSLFNPQHDQSSYFRLNCSFAWAHEIEQACVRMGEMINTLIE